MEISDAERLRELEEENVWLKRMVAVVGRTVLSTCFVSRRLLSQTVEVTAQDPREALASLHADIRARLPTEL